MRKRWQVLSAIASFGVMGFFGVIARFGMFPTTATFWLGFGGFAIACGIALWAAINDYQRRWPAAVALVAIAPFLQHLKNVLVTPEYFYRSQLDFLSLAVIGSSIGTVGAAIVILLTYIPPPELPTARI